MEIKEPLYKFRKGDMVLLDVGNGKQQMAEVVHLCPAQNGKAMYKIEIHWWWVDDNDIKLLNER